VLGNLRGALRTISGHASGPPLQAARANADPLGSRGPLSSRSVRWQDWKGLQELVEQRSGW